MNQFLLRYQQKFCIDNVNFASKEDAFIDFEQFRQADRNINRMEAFKESIRNLHNPAKVRDKQTKSEQQEYEERLVEEMYQQVINHRRALMLKRQS